MRSDAKNLEAISKAIDQHDFACPFPVVEVLMNPYEVERLGWEDIRGIPVVGDEKIGTGRFRLICASEGAPLDEEVEAVSKDRLVPAAA